MKVNKPLGFDVAAVHAVHVNRSAVEHRCASLGGRRSFKQEAQVAAHVRAISCLDLTVLAGDDTPGCVKRLCEKAKKPVRREILAALGVDNIKLTTGAVCVYPAMVPAAVAALCDTEIPVAAVATGFPAGQVPLNTKLAEIEGAITAGAREIDIVISRAFVLAGEWGKLYDEIAEFRAACGDRAHMKTILGVGNLRTLENVAKASIVAIQAGADFIKTSTGFEPTNATLPTALVMLRAIREAMDKYEGLVVGFKPAGGIRTAKDAMSYLALVLEELGEEATYPGRFRIGASGLLTDIERQLEHLATGRYAAARDQPAA